MRGHRASSPPGPCSPSVPVTTQGQTVPPSGMYARWVAADRAATHRGSAGAQHADEDVGDALGVVARSGEVGADEGAVALEVAVAAGAPHHGPHSAVSRSARLVGGADPQREGP